MADFRKVDDKWINFDNINTISILKKDSGHWEIIRNYFQKEKREYDCWPLFKHLFNTQSEAQQFLDNFMKDWDNALK